jgi:hypothetical protein
VRAAFLYLALPSVLPSLSGTSTEDEAKQKQTRAKTKRGKSGESKARNVICTVCLSINARKKEQHTF